MIAPTTEQLRLSDFDYDLPESLIAQEPTAQRDRFVDCRSTGYQTSVE